MKMDNRLVEVYEAPRAEFVEMKTETRFLQVSPGGDIDPGTGEEG